jgi:23S rRNA pseudouridine2457 synthase
MPTLALFKPYGVLCRFTDEAGRPTLADYVDVPDVYPAGRLDKDSEGLLLLTDDGRLASLITHPRHKLPKVYLAQVEHIPEAEALARLRVGVEIKGGKTRPAQADLLAAEPDLPPRPVPIRYRKSIPTAWLRITLREGRNRQVRRMTAAVGHPTLRLVRIAIGPVELGTLQPGEWRELSAREVKQLRVESK